MYKRQVYEESAAAVAEVVFVMDRFGYCKLLDRTVYERNRETVDNEYKYVIPCLNTDKLCIFTDTGNLHQVKMMDIPSGKLRDKGTPIDNLSKYDEMCIRDRLFLGRFFAEFYEYCCGVSV